MLRIFSSVIFVLFSGAVVSGSADWSKANESHAAVKEIEVYYSKTCSCCKKWMSHLNDHGFEVVPRPVDNMKELKNKYGVKGEYASCHTALIDGYVVEGHVPADDIKRLLKLRPKIKGLSVPAMPVGTPGMEQGERKDPFYVITLPEQGEPKVFNAYENY